MNFIANRSSASNHTLRVKDFVYYVFGTVDDESLHRLVQDDRWVETQGSGGGERHPEDDVDKLFRRIVYVEAVRAKSARTVEKRERDERSVDYRSCNDVPAIRLVVED